MCPACSQSCFVWFQWGFTVLSDNSWLVAGGRDLAPEFAPLVAEVCGGLPALIVGCAIGADELALNWALSSGSVPRVRCFCAFGLGGAGSVGSVSAVGTVGAFAAAGGRVEWFSGGGAHVPPSARLASRTRAAVGAATGGAVVFFSSTASRGSFLAASTAAARGLPVFAHACGAFALPSLAPGGHWQRSARFVGSWQWCPPASLF